MIRGVHTMFYTSDAEATRAFLRDKLNFPFTDVGGGWLIFEMPEADMGCHPVGTRADQQEGMHAISFYCDDIRSTVDDLTARGVEFIKPIMDAGYGLTTLFRMPGGVVVELYQPYYKKDPTTV